MDAWPRGAWYGAVFATCLVAATACTWPLALHFASAVPRGTETAATVPVFDVWTLWWAADRAVHGYGGLWDAPIFHPAQGAFAFSEPLLLPGTLAAPLFALRAPPALAHNFALFALLGSNGAFACRLARALGVPRFPALLAALSTVALPFLAKVQGELPVVWVGGALAALDGAVRFGAGGRTRDAVTTAAGLVAQALTSQQLALFAGPFVGAAALVALAERRFARVSVARLAAAAAAAAIVVTVIGRAPARVHEQLAFARDADLVQALSARPGDFLSRPATASLPFPAREDPASYTQGLFPGALVLALAAFGATQPLPDPRRWRWRWYALASCQVAFLLALGLNLSVGGWRPFAALRLLPGVAEVRSVFRCAVFVQMHLAILAALGLAAIARRAGESAGAKALVFGVGLLAAAENLSVPAPLLPLPRSPRTGWTAFLAAQPPATVVAHLPFPGGGSVEDLAPEAWRMFAQIDHRQPLVNGYASHFPPLHRELLFALARAPIDRPLACALRRAFGADLLVVDQGWLSAHRPAFEDLAAMLAPEYADDAVAIFRIAPPADECPPLRLQVGP
jgi:hypothetical protein